MGTEPYGEHVALLAQLRKGDVAGAEHALSSHIASARKRLLTYLSGMSENNRADADADIIEALPKRAAPARVEAVERARIVAQHRGHKLRALYPAGQRLQQVAPRRQRRRDAQIGPIAAPHQAMRRQLRQRAQQAPSASACGIDPAVARNGPDSFTQPGPSLTRRNTLRKLSPLFGASALSPAK